jgi:hypothetical protein
MAGGQGHPLRSSCAKAMVQGQPTRARALRDPLTPRRRRDGGGLSGARLKTSPAGFDNQYLPVYWSAIGPRFVVNLARNVGLRHLAPVDPSAPETMRRDHMKGKNGPAPWWCGSLSAAVAALVIMPATASGPSKPTGADLIVRADVLAQQWVVRDENLPSSACSVQEGSVTPGIHRESIAFASNRSKPPRGLSPDLRVQL